MKKSIKILFPTDFSAPSANAFEYALILADRLNANIEVLHVVYPQTEAMDIPLLVSTATKELVDVGREVLKVFINKGIKEVKDKITHQPEIASNIEIGMPGKLIPRIAERDDADLIVMGSRGENRLAIDKLIGSVAAGVVNIAHCPVMVIPEESQFQEPAVLAYATDIQAGDPFEVWQSMQLLKPLQPLVHIVHVNLGNTDSIKTWERMEELKHFFESKDFNSEIRFHHIHGTELNKSLNKFVEEEGVNFLVMYQPSRNFWSRLFHKSQTKKMAIHTHVPLLVQKD